MRHLGVLIIGLALSACTAKFGAMKAAVGAQQLFSNQASSATSTTPGVLLPGVTVTPGVTTPPVVAPALPAAIAGLNYKMTFDDEFNSLDTISNGPIAVTGAKWYNGTEQCCMGDSTGLPGVMFPTVYNGISVNPYSLIPGGGLNITLTKKNNVWYSGVLTSVDSKGVGFSQKYGYFEMSANLSGDPGSWPAFWMLNTSNLTGNQASTGGGGEIDIFEQYNKFHTGFCTTFHDWSGGTTPYYNCGITVADQTVGYHKYGLLWTESTMSIYFDDVQVATTPTPAVMKQPYYLLMDMGLGGGWPTTDTPATSAFKVKYVRAYAAQ